MESHTKDIAKDIRKMLRTLDKERTKLEAALVALDGRRGRRPGSKNKPKAPAVKSPPIPPAQHPTDPQERYAPNP